MKKIAPPKPKKAGDVLSLEELTFVMGSEKDAKALMAEVDKDGSVLCSLLRLNPFIAATVKLLSVSTPIG